MKNNSINNADTNNNFSNNNLGGIAMMNGTINNMKDFADTIRAAVEVSLGAGYEIEIHDVLKNNSTHLTGLTIRDEEYNVAPTIYLEDFFEKYRNGIGLDRIIEEIGAVHNSHRAECDFDPSMVTDFDRVKNKLCYKLVSAPRNKELLCDAPHLIVCGDLAVLFYILVSSDYESTATITVRNNMTESWGISADGLFKIALVNTQSLFRGSVRSMASVMMDLLGDCLDGEGSKEFYDMAVSGEDKVPMYVCTNDRKLNGAGVILYKDLLKEFADRTGRDFYILPSSIHETLLVPVSEDMEPDYLRAMVREVNATQVAEDEVLSDNVYLYQRATDEIKLA